MPPDPGTQIDPIAQLPPLREVVAAAGLTPSRSLGQNFLFDLNLTAKIARAAGDLAGATVIEIGPGPGGLTRALVRTAAAEIVAIERDRRCAEALQPLIEAAAGRLTLIEADALTVDVTAIGSRPRWIVANLPYNVSTALLTRWLGRIDAIDGMVLMFQREVAERLVARPATKAYGRLSVLTQWLAEPRLLFDLPPAAFLPPPKVTSTVVAIAPRPPDPGRPPVRAMERVTAAAFGQRRKMLRQSLKALGDAASLLQGAGLKDTVRAEDLEVADFERLTRLVAARENATHEV